MEDDRQNGAVIARPPGTSDTCGTIVNHGTAASTSGSDRAAAPPPPPHHALRFNLAPRAAAPANVIGTPPVRGAAPPYGVHLNNNNNNPVIKGQNQPKVRTERRERGKRRFFRPSSCLLRLPLLGPVLPLMTTWLFLFLAAAAVGFPSLLFLISYVFPFLLSSYLYFLLSIDDCLHFFLAVLARIPGTTIRLD